MRVSGRCATRERGVWGLISQVCEVTQYSEKFVSNTQVLPSVHRFMVKSPRTLE